MKSALIIDGTLYPVCKAMSWHYDDLMAWQLHFDDEELAFGFSTLAEAEIELVTAHGELPLYPEKIAGYSYKGLRYLDRRPEAKSRGYIFMCTQVESEEYSAPV
jgi:hypothetical protein